MAAAGSVAANRSSDSTNASSEPIRRQVERAKRPRHHELQPAGHTELTAAGVVRIRKKSVEELRDADDRPAITGGHRALYRHAAVAGKTHDVRRGHAGDLAAHHLQRDLTGDRHGFVGPQSNPG